MNTSKYKDLFLEEIGGHLESIESALLTIEEKPSQSDVVNLLFRHFHSIKGMSASMGYIHMSGLAHCVEDVLDGYRWSDAQPQKDDIAILLEGLDALKDMAGMVDRGDPVSLDIKPLVAKIKNLMENASYDKMLKVIPPQGGLEPKIRLPKTMKVKDTFFDELLVNIGELFTIRSVLKHYLGSDADIGQRDGLHKLSKSIDNLYNTVLKARMVPVELLTHSLPRVVRDLCKAMGKEVKLTVNGSDIKLDKMVLEAIGDPIIHIIRNAVDHGIESEDERKRCGKPSYGRVEITVTRDKDRVIMEITDDGKGIDVEKVRSKAYEMDVPKEEIEAMTEESVMMLVCLPGLSLASEVTEVSGRGMGMDVIKHGIESIGASLNIESKKGKGTTITMCLPLTVSIMKIFLVHLGKDVFGIPLSKVMHVVGVDNTTKTTYGGEAMPVFFLRNLLGINKDQPVKEEQIVIVRTDEKIVGIRIDGFCEEVDAYIRPLVSPLSEVKGISDFTILGDGRPVFILDIGNLLG